MRIRFLLQHLQSVKSQQNLQNWPDTAPRARDLYFEPIIRREQTGRAWPFLNLERPTPNQNPTSEGFFLGVWLLGVLLVGTDLVSAAAFFAAIASSIS